MMHGGNVWQGTSPREWLDFSANLRPEGPPEWVKEAHDLGMSVNVWTVDNPEDIRAMRDLGVDQITTDKPALAREILWER